MTGSSSTGGRVNRAARPGLGGVLCAALLAVGCSVAGAESTEESEARKIVDALALATGMHVADVGAGDGEWALELARVVGPEGHVYATEVDEDDLESMTATMAAESLSPYTAILGDQDRIGLPADCCDGILLRLVYHHFQKPEVMRAALAAALRPGARLVVVDIAPQTDWRDLPGVPDRGGHGITIEGLIAEMAEDGFEVVERIDDWPGDEDRFCVVFRRE